MHFTGGTASPSLVDNPNHLEADEQEQIFHCFTNVQVELFDMELKMKIVY